MRTGRSSTDLNVIKESTSETDYSSGGICSTRPATLDSGSIKEPTRRESNFTSGDTDEQTSFDCRSQKSSQHAKKLRR
jgi:hypothetical protein